MELMIMVINDHGFMSLYMYKMFSPSHWGRANLGFETRVSSLVNNDLRSKGFSNAGLSFCGLITKN